MTDPRQGDQELHSLHVRYGRAVELLAQQQHVGVELFLQRRDPDHQVRGWLDLTQAERNVVRCGVDELLAHKRAELQDAAQLAADVFGGP